MTRGELVARLEHAAMILREVADELTEGPLRRAVVAGVRATQAALAWAKGRRPPRV